MEIYKFISKLTNELNKNLFYNIEIDKPNHQEQLTIKLLSDTIDKLKNHIINSLEDYKTASWG